MEAWTVLALGLAVGAVGGVLGLGGGIMMVPGLIYIFGFSQKAAQGTTLAALVPPVGLLAAIQYYRQGFCDPWAAVWLAIGFAVGAFITAGFIEHIDAGLLSQLFGMLLLFLGVRMILSSRPLVHAFAGAVVAWLFAWAIFLLLRHFSARFGARPRFDFAPESASAPPTPSDDYQI